MLAQRGFEEQHEERKTREAEQPDSNAGHLNRLEERDPMQGQQETGSRELPLESAARFLTLARKRKQESQNQTGDRRATEDDRHRRQRQPLAEQAREPEQQHREMQRCERARTL